jgi:flagellar basal-body rod protein FlgG
MGKGGEIVLSTRTPVIDAQGRIREPTATSGASAADPAAIVAELKLVRFESGGALRRMGDGLFAGGDGMVDVPEGAALVRQGALERSNVSSMQEMVRLLETMRHFESMQRVAQGYDEMLGNAIRRLGDLG